MYNVLWFVDYFRLILAFVVFDPLGHKVKYPRLEDFAVLL